jgi:outer membrane immunogenic protein
MALPIRGTRNVKHLIAMSCGALALVTAGAASAADLPVRAPAPNAPAFGTPVYNWTGFYLGINGGWASSHKCWDFEPGPGLALIPEGCHNATGGAAGGQIGFNWQSGPLVFGVEFTGDWTSLTGSNNSLAFVAPQNTNRTKVDAIAALTGRFGYAWDAALIYVKGGGAWVGDKYDARDTATGVVNSSATETRAGWTAGAGFEYGFTPNWSVAVEYDHYDFGSKTVAFTGLFSGNDRIGQTVDMVTARLNWRFGWGGPATRY